MRIWIVNHYAGGPELGTGWRHWELARRWVRLGGSVRILAASTSIGGQRHARRVGEQELDSVRFSFIDAPAYGGNGAGRLRNILAFNRGAAREMSRLLRARAERPDVIIASSPQPLAWPASMRAAREANAAFVPEIRDLWPESLVELGGMPGWHPLVQWCRWVDARACRAASMVLSPLAGIDKAMRSRGHAAVRCMVVPNGVSLEEGDPPALDADLFDWVDAARSGGRRLVLYAGAMGVPNALDQLLDALELLAEGDVRRVQVLMVGDGSERERLQARSATRALPVRFAGARPQSQVRALCRACDVGFLGWLDRPLYRFGIAPQKRGLMLGEGLPILHAVPHRLVDEGTLGTGWSVPAGDAMALRDALRSMLAASDRGLEDMREAAREHAAQELDWDRIAGIAWCALLEATPRHPAALSTVPGATGPQPT